MTEEWKPVLEYEGKYDVSNVGNVRSWVASDKDSRPLLLRHRNMSGGYVGFTLCGKTKLAHVLTLEAFVSARPGHPRLVHACHNDGNVKNNSVSNLRWDTVSNNHADKLAHGTDHNGEKNPSVKLTKSQVTEIRERIKVAKWGDVSKIAAMYGVDQTTISDIKTGRSWVGA